MDNTQWPKSVTACVCLYFVEDLKITRTAAEDDECV